jgi:arabinogalactan endo-1,4-beta-galactosidase
MRTGYVLRSAAGVALVAAVCGCGNDGNGNGPPPGPDSSAADVAITVTDGSVDDGAPDASVGDAAQDSGEAGGGSEFDAPFFLGADITFTQQDESNGATYADDDGTIKPILEILKSHGLNYIRLRTFVDPTQPAPKPGGGTFAPYSTQGFGDMAHTIVFGQQIKAAGMGFLLDFHYSDYWADPGKQIKPAAWVGDNLAAAVTHLHDYTFASIQALVAAGARPDMVQIGNEITPGMLLTPSPSLGGRSPSGWPGFAQLLNAGIQAVHEVDPAIKIMLHIDRGGDVGGLDGGNAGAALANSIDFIDNALANSVNFDVFGESCYVSYQGPPASWQYTLNALATTFPNLKFVMAEYNSDPAPAIDSCDLEIRQANDIVFNLPNHQGLGTFFWEPTHIIGTQNPGMFSINGNVYSTRPSCIDQYDQMKVDYGL